MPPPPSSLRTDIPHSARIYDYVLGGKDNFEADRVAAEKMLASTPSLRTSMRANRRWMARATAYLAGRGIRQFLDIGTGLPTHPNLHEVAQGVRPDATVVYVDNDPLVLVHARALLTPVGTGKVSYLEADLREPPAILGSDAVRDQFDLARPVAVSIIAVLQHIVDDAQAKAVVDAVMAPMAPGSALVMSVVTIDNDQSGDQVIGTYNRSGVPSRPRTHAQVAALFGDLEVVDPGVVFVHKWHPDEADRSVADTDVFMYGGVAFKP